jgi:hypothetical protein
MEKKINTSKEMMGNPEETRPLGRSVRGCRNVAIDVKEIGWTMWIRLMWIKMGISGCCL